MDTRTLAVNAAMAMLDRYGGLWADDEHVRQQLEVIIDAVAELEGWDDDPMANGAARATLESMLKRDAKVA